MSGDEKHSLRIAMLEAVEKDLKNAVQPIESDLYPELARMIYHHMGWLDDAQSGGKRIRPLITLLCCAGAGGEWRNALPAASAIELIHNFTLIHDDIEDHSETRRGRATLWKLWGIPQAINAGDSLFTISRLTTHRLIEVDTNPDKVLEVQRILDQACLRLTQGQYLDLSFETQERVTIAEYLEMIEGKTSALLAASSMIGANLAGVSRSRSDKYRAFGYHLGLAFQAQDDILGIWGDPEQTGKPASDDIRQRKKTLPTVYAMESSPSFADLFSKNRDQITIQDLHEALDQVDALEYTRVFSQHQTELALEALEEADPIETAGKELENIARDLTNRQS
jgi:geranylgeranyl diphosphate synthase type I